MKSSDIADLIVIKNNLVNLIESTIAINKADVPKIQAKIVELDKIIIQASINLDLTDKPQSLREYRSTEDVEAVAKKHIERNKEVVNEDIPKQVL